MDIIKIFFRRFNAVSIGRFFRSKNDRKEQVFQNMDKVVVYLPELLKLQLHVRTCTAHDLESH